MDRENKFSAEHTHLQHVISKHIRHCHNVLDRRREVSAPLYAERQCVTRKLKIMHTLMMVPERDIRQTTMPAIGRILAEDRLCYD